MWDNRMIMRLFSRSRLVAAFVLAGAAACSRHVFAQAPAAAMHVGATVAPQCRIVVDEATTGDDRSPSVRVTCGRRGLHVLRVSGGPATAISPIAALEKGGLRAGAEVVFVVPHAIATVASLVPSIGSTPAAREPVVVTLDF
jgi:hypothetical protein